MDWQDTLANLVARRLPFDLDWLPLGTCLVGGAVRDALLDRQRDYLDLDLVLPCYAVETARKVANAYQAGFVVLDDRRQIARVVFEQGTVDFALLEGDSLESDLRRRDFTVNAIAYDLFARVAIDPLHGRADLERRCLRMISVENLADDPLRLLRAYRQAAQLDFSLDPDTQTALRLLAPKIAQIAAERVQVELNYLLSHRRGLTWLKTAWEDGLIQPWLGEIAQDKIERASAIDPAARQLHELTGCDFSPHQQRLGKLASLASDRPEIAEQELLRLKYSRFEIRTVTVALRHLGQLQQATALSLREQYFLFDEVGKVFPVLALLAVAAGVEIDLASSLLDRFLDPADPVAHPQSLVTGKDLIDRLSLKPSPLVGQLLTALQVAQIEGQIRTAEEAIALARHLASEWGDR